MDSTIHVLSNTLVQNENTQEKCPTLTSTGVLDSAPCHQKNGFICQTDGQDCNTWKRTPECTANHVENQKLNRRAVRSVASQTSIPDLVTMAMQLDAAGLSGSSSVAGLLFSIDYAMENEEDTNKTYLVTCLQGLEQLSNYLQLPDIRSSALYTNLTTVVYFGVNSLLQAILTSCSEIMWTTSERQNLTLLAVDILSSIQQSSNVTQEASLQTPMFSILQTSFNSSTVGHQVLSTPNSAAEFVFPSQSALQSVLQSVPFLHVQMMTFPANPFIKDTSINITTTVASLSFLSEDQELYVHNLQESFQVFLQQQSPSNNTQQFNISADKALQLSLKATPYGSTLVVIITVNQGVKLDLYHGRDLVSKTQLTKQNDTDSYKWILAPEMFSNPNASQLFLVAPSNTAGLKSLQMGVSTFSVQCVYWSPDKQMWNSDGCVVGPQTNPSQVQCLCNHLTFFGSSFLVKPVEVDVTRTAEYFARIAENPVFVILLACFFAVYILVVLWARKMDRRDQAQSRIIVPPDNDPFGLYHYLITVDTGRRRGAGTSAKVHLSIAGMDSPFGPILLSDGRRRLFRTGSVDVFLVHVPFPLGELKALTLSHDATGPHKTWYVSQVTILDVQLNKFWHFLCNSWLSNPPKGDSLSKTFKAAADEELRSFRNIFIKKTLQGFWDEHIWLSVLNHPPRSVFTRVQRVSCCMCLLLCTIVINLMFWEMPQGSYPVLISLGSFNLTWKDIMIAVESALLMFPVNLLIIFIFRNTRPKEKSSEGKTKKGKKVPNAKTGQTRQLSLATVMEDLLALARTLSQTSRNSLEVDLNQESSQNVMVLLQIIPQLLQKQFYGPLTVSGPLSQLSNDDLHVLFCGHYVSRKLKKVSSDLHQLGNHSIPDQQEYEGILTQLEAVVELVDKSLSPLPAQRPSQKKEVKKKRLPWWFLFVGWFLLIAISVVSTYFSMMYGFLYGRESSIRWIISMALSLFQSIFILQPLKVVGFAIFFALVLKKVDEDEDDLLDGEFGASEEYQIYDETTL
ncbi:polycystin-1-like protein 2 isoform X2 [Hyperolius riggenbachi]|uniref:polycystin-1-like protein 2 isoform X2 n=1 Tax=Hyperolius riggenbachi TaxID=752182 RepID=UPI0035A33A86